MRLRACIALLLYVSACATSAPSLETPVDRGPRLSNLQRAAALPWTDGGRCIVQEASHPWPVLAERCYHALDHDRVEFHDTTGRCAVASAGAAAMGLGVCVLAAPEIVVGTVVVMGIVVVGFAIKEALAEEKRSRPQVRPAPETRPVPATRPVPETKPAPPKLSQEQKPKTSTRTRPTFEKLWLRVRWKSCGMSVPALWLVDLTSGWACEASCTKPHWSALPAISGDLSSSWSGAEMPATQENEIAITVYAPALVGNDGRPLSVVHGMERALPGLHLEWTISSEGKRIPVPQREAFLARGRPKGRGFPLLRSGDDDFRVTVTGLE